MLSLVDIDQAVLEKMMKMWKICNDNDKQIFCSEKLTWASGSGKLIKHWMCLCYSIPSRTEYLHLGLFKHIIQNLWNHFILINNNFALWSRLLSKGLATKLHKKVIYFMQTSFHQSTVLVDRTLYLNLLRNNFVNCTNEFLKKSCQKYFTLY